MESHGIVATAHSSYIDHQTKLTRKFRAVLAALTLYGDCVSYGFVG